MGAITVDLAVLDPTLAVTESNQNGWVIRRKTANEITDTRSGSRYVAKRWPVPRRVYEIPHELLKMTERRTLRDWFDIYGTDTGFLIWDADEHYVANQNLGEGNGSTTAFQLIQTKTNGIRSVNRNITKPVPTGTAIPLNLQGDGGGATSASHTISFGEVQQLSISGTPTGGYTVLTFGANSCNVQYNYTAAQVQAALATIGIVAVCYGGPLPGSAVQIGFVTPGGSQSLITTSDHFTGGSSPTSSLARLTAGAAKTEGTDYSVSPSTGIVTTLTTALALYQQMLWTGWNYVPVAFETDDIEFQLHDVHGAARPSFIELFNV